MLKSFFQLVRFAGIGFLNSAVDFALLNLLAVSFVVYQGAQAGAINTVSFSIAVLHSYFWNKYWAFGSADSGFFKNFGKFFLAALLGVGILAAVIWGSRQQFGAVYYLFMIILLAAGELLLWRLFRLSAVADAAGARREILLFLAISIIAAFINSGIVALVTAKVAPVFGLNRELWLNLVKAAATAISLLWNFVGYKLVVFKR